MEKGANQPQEVFESRYSPSKYGNMQDVELFLKHQKESAEKNVQKSNPESGWGGEHLLIISPFEKL